ncbi:MAG: HypC/HybG/HupF family hydrogenase formation chaperone [Burkholderiaceae bacterium]|nr:HypC/HybG/HupF family hydrogenase formation chaperone [Burkholderiaceae bacterium]
MCIGLPMQVLHADDGRATATGRGRTEAVDTRLVGPVQPGDWLLVFQGAARERLHPQRAAEIGAALALLDAAMAGDATGATADPGFALPSSLDPDFLASLAGAPTPGAPR